MAKPPFLILADRGTLKAYQVDKTPAHGTMPHLVEEQTFQEAHGRYQDKVTDQAGSFPVGGSGGNANAIAEKHGIEEEGDIRLFKTLGRHIDEIVRKHQPLSWSFAAPAEVNAAILEQVSADVRQLLRTNVKHDLVRIPADSLLKHFDK